MDAYIQDDVAIEKVGDCITKKISAFGIQAAAVVLYDQPAEFKKPFDFFNLPSKARLISCYDYSSDAQLTKFKHVVEFNPAECIIPEGYLNYSGEGLIVMSLFRNNIQYGYVHARTNPSRWQEAPPSRHPELLPFLLQQWQLRRKQEKAIRAQLGNVSWFVDYLRLSISETGNTLLFYADR